MRFLPHVSAAVLSVLSTQAYAQSNDWSYASTIYLFGAETHTSITTPTVALGSTLSFKDAIENLDFAYMGALEAHNGRWGVLGDLMYQDLSFRNPTPGPAFGGIQANLELSIVQVGGLYRAYESSTARIDLAGGARWVSIDSTIGTLPGLAPAVTSTSSRDWVDPVVGVRAQVDFSDKWSTTALMDYGGFSDDSESFQGVFTVNYDASEHWTLRAGYRALSVENTEGGVKLHIQQQGPIFGATYNF